MLVGLAFLAKMLQSFLVLPALVAVYALYAGVTWRRRLLHLLAAAAGLVVAAGWWIAIVMAWPAASRPYIGGSQHNSILELTLGYNGFGRLNGSETGSVGGGNTTGGQWGATGLFRMFGSEVGSQVGWLIPAALVLGVAGPVVRPRPRRSGRPRRADAVARLARSSPASPSASWPGSSTRTTPSPSPRRSAPWSGSAGSSSGGTATRSSPPGSWGPSPRSPPRLSYELLARDASWHPWLRYAVLVVGFVAAALIVGVHHLPRRIARRGRCRGAGRRTRRPRGVLRGDGGHPALRLDPERRPVVGRRVRTRRWRPGWLRWPAASAGPPGAATGRATGATTGGASTGGLLDGSTSSAALTTLLETDASSYTWVAAAIGSNSAAGYQLATQEPVMAIGGFNGSDPSPTLAQFQQWVSHGKIHYFIAQGGGFGAGGGGGPNAARRHVVADRIVGREHLHREDGRRRHRLRPDHRLTTIVPDVWWWRTRFPQPNVGDYPVRPDPGGGRRADSVTPMAAPSLPTHVDHLIVGSGFAGLCAAIKLAEDGETDYLVIEKGDDVGGTWRDNTYPGACCDIPSQLYSFSFARNPDWTSSYSPQPEIQAYLRRVAQEYGVTARTVFDTELEHAAWDDATQRWHIRTSSGEVTARTLVAGAGSLSEPRLPEIEGDRGASAGALFHSARWDHSVDLAGKRVAVIGTGASAIQIVPEVQQVAAHLDVYQRTAPWVIPRDDRTYPKAERAALRRIPRTRPALPGGHLLGARGLRPGVHLAAAPGRAGAEGRDRQHPPRHQGP